MFIYCWRRNGLFIADKIKQQQEIEKLNIPGNGLVQ
jgi:hypothetical protein